MLLDGKRVLVTGGTGSLGKTAVHRLLTGEMGSPEQITVFSRDEAKQHDMRLEYLKTESATDEVIYSNFKKLLRFRIGDVREYPSLVQAVMDADVVIHAAALKQVPTCEYFPSQAVNTNILGAENLVRAIRENQTSVETVVGVSTDKACKPINVMGMTKAIMERILVEANMGQQHTRFICVRYGNVIASRGSVLPLFLDQIANGGPVTITHPDMTRFLITLDRAVDVVFAAMKEARSGEIYIPKIPAALITDVAEVLIAGRDIELVFTGIRPGEKMHEALISEEESFRSIDRGDHYAISPMLPELEPETVAVRPLNGEYSSSDVSLTPDGLRELLREYLDRRESLAT
jgi:UDP-glucose 4-epimerase